jgi:hypothetical protein
MTDVAQLGIRVDSAQALKAVSDLDRLAIAGAKAEVATTGIGVASGRVAPAMGKYAHQSRMVAQQLSQVAQQSAATGQVMQAVAIQAADIGLAFGTIGTVVGMLVTIGLPMAMQAFNATGVESDALKEKQESLKDAIDEVTAATAAYQLTRAMNASGATLESEQALLTEINKLTAERSRLMNEQAVLQYSELEATSLQAASERAALSEKQNALRISLSEIEAALQRLNYEREIDLATRRRANEARNAYREAAAALAQQNASMATAYGLYAKTRGEGEKLADAAADAGVAASDL